MAASEQLFKSQAEHTRQKYHKQTAQMFGCEHGGKYKPTVNGIDAYSEQEIREALQAMQQVKKPGGKSVLQSMVSHTGGKPTDRSASSMLPPRNQPSSSPSVPAIEDAHAGGSSSETCDHLGGTTALVPALALRRRAKTATTILAVCNATTAAGDDEEELAETQSRGRNKPLSYWFTVITHDKAWRREKQDQRIDFARQSCEKSHTPWDGLAGFICVCCPS